jgi:non-canonical poly(A) RNA polymerase PAPD5/7
MYSVSSIGLTANMHQHGSARPLPEYMLALRDPADETNDLGRKGIAIKHVQVTLKDLSHQLEVDRRTNTRPSLLGPLVGTSYMNDYARRRKLQTHGHHLLDQMHKSMAAQAKAVREGNNLEAEESEDSEVLKRQLEEEETKQRLAKEERDRAWQKLADERNERLREVAQRTSVLEHGEAMASILGMPAVEEEAQATGESKKA